MKRITVVFILALAFCGLADSSYLAQHETAGTPLLCNIGSLSGCNIVAASPYSRLFGIPLAEYGVLFYGIVFVLAALELAVFDRLLRRALQVISLVGVGASLYFISIQVFVIGALCIYCLASALVAFLIFVLASSIEPVRRGKREHEPPSFPSSPVSVPHLSMPPAA